MSTVRFRERLSGYISFAETDYNQALLDGKRVGRRCAFSVEIGVPDVRAFLATGSGPGSLSGHIDCPELGGRLVVDGGTFELFVDEGDARMKRMRYRLFAKDADGRRLTLSGFKDVADSPNADLWADTTTLMVRVLAGRVEQHDEEDASAMAARTIATGVMRISLGRFLLLLTSLRATGGSPGDKLSALGRFVWLFGKQLMQVYRGSPVKGHLPDFPDPVKPGSERFHGRPPGEWHQPPELPGLWRRIVDFRTRDCHTGTLHNVRLDPFHKGGVPVLLIHGTGVRANLFYGAPGHPSIVRELLKAGYDVWLENWRASIDLPPQDYTLDGAGRYDHPAAILEVLRRTKKDSLRVLCHCQGSTSFMITYVTGSLPRGTVDAVVSSAVSLHPIVTKRSQVKAQALVPVTGFLTPYISAQWGARPPTALAGAVAHVSRWSFGLDHDPVCALGNFMYGSGRDVLWQHENLDAATHHWTSREFGYAPFRFFRQMLKSVRRGHLVPVDPHHGKRLPDDYYVPKALPERIPWTFIGGECNRLFLPESQERTFECFQKLQPGLHSFELIDGAGHLDVLFGIQAPKQSYPKILAGLDRDGRARIRPTRAPRPTRAAPA
jgi:hypothetical protein